MALSRRGFVGLGALGAAGAAAFALRRKLKARLSAWTRDPAFAATPPLVPHDPARDKRTIAVARGGAPADNVDAALGKLPGGLGGVIGGDDVVIVKVSAQWWNQGMTNVAAARRVVEQVLAVPGFTGEVIVFENTHFQLADGSGLSRAWTRPSERNVDVPGWDKLGDLQRHFAGDARVSFVGLVDGGKSSLAGDHWHDPSHQHGVYGGDGRGGIAAGDARDGYHWDFARAFRLKKSWIEHAQTPLTWPRFTSPRSGLVVDLADGVMRREGGRLVAEQRRLKWISVVTANEHAATGFTGCCKSAMGVVDMSAGRLGSDARVQGYQSVHYFGSPDATWRMAGPLAHFALKVRAPDLYVVAAEWVAATPAGVPWDGEKQDIRMAEASAFRTRTVVAGTDPVAIDAWCVRELLMPIRGANAAMLDLDDPDSKVSRFLRYYRLVYGSGTLDASLVTVV
jgi:hypothetical protein